MAKRRTKTKHVTPKRESDVGVPDQIVAQMLESLRNEGPLPWGQVSAAEELESAFQDFLDLNDPEGAEDEDADEVFIRLSDRLDQVRVNANGGDSEARNALAAFRGRLGQAVAEGEIHPANMIILGRVLWNAGVSVPDDLREAVGEAMGGALALAPENAENVAKLALGAIERIEDPFELYEAAAANMAAFPARFRIALAAPLVAGRKRGSRMGAVGFVLHPEEALATAVIKAFPFSAPRSPAENAVVERLNQIAPWLPPGRREMAEAAFAAMGAGDHATPAVANKIVRLVASSHDGSGANSLVACVQTKKRLVSLSVLMKSEGVADVVELAGLGRDDAERVIALMGSTSPIVDVSADGVAELLALALGRNVSAGVPPPFRLLQFCELVGLTGLRPDLSSPAQTLDKLLANAPAEGLSAEPGLPGGLRYSPFTESWFETGERVEKLLGSTKSSKTATRKVLHEYLPSRRQFWARLCANSALVLQRRAGAADEFWREFALVGREIARETPLDRIPLMSLIAERTVKAYFDRP